MFTKKTIDDILAKFEVENKDGNLSKALFEIIKEYDKGVGALDPHKRL